MKRQLCWSIKDILYAQAREGFYNKPKVNARLVNLHKTWSPADYEFYKYFRTVMEHKIAEQSQDFQEEVALFQQHLAQTRDFCNGVCNKMGQVVLGASRESMSSILHKTTVFTASKWDAGFMITGLECLLMRFEPSVFRNIQKVRLFPEFCTHSNATLNTLDIDPAYCYDHFEHSIPWSVILRPYFTSTCY